MYIKLISVKSFVRKTSSNATSRRVFRHIFWLFKSVLQRVFLLKSAWMRCRWDFATEKRWTTFWLQKGFALLKFRFLWEKWRWPWMKEVKRLGLRFWNIYDNIQRVSYCWIKYKTIKGSNISSFKNWLLVSIQRCSQAIFGSTHKASPGASPTLSQREGNINYLYHYNYSQKAILLERFSNECRKTKTKVITPANHNKHKLPNEPIRTRSKDMYGRRQARENACEREQVATDWFQFYSWLVEKVARDFLTNHRAK